MGVFVESGLWRSFDPPEKPCGYLGGPCCDNSICAPPVLVNTYLTCKNNKCVWVNTSEENNNEITYAGGSKLECFFNKCDQSENAHVVDNNNFYDFPFNDLICRSNLDCFVNYLCKPSKFVPLGYGECVEVPSPNSEGCPVGYFKSQGHCCLWGTSWNNNLNNCSYSEGRICLVPNKDEIYPSNNYCGFTGSCRLYDKSNNLGHCCPWPKLWSVKLNACVSTDFGECTNDSDCYLDGGLFCCNGSGSDDCVIGKVAYIHRCLCPKVGDVREVFNYSAHTCVLQRS